MAMLDTFKVTKHSKNFYTVKTPFNYYEIRIDKEKGVGIYMMFQKSNLLIKSYKHTKVETAINYLFKEFINY